VIGTAPQEHLAGTRPELPLVEPGGAVRWWRGWRAFLGASWLNVAGVALVALVLFAAEIGRASCRERV